jgi:anthranilate phosphoribosyltransferase
MTINEAIKIVESGKDLNAEQARDVFDMIFKGDAKPEQIASLLMALRNKGEAVSELHGAVLSMRGNMKPVTVPEGAIDIVGTGGDGHGTFNVSTAAALVTAGSGVCVAKHGNRAATSLSGSSDVLNALGINLEAEREILERAAQEVGIVFLFAPRHHPAMKHVAEVRKKLGVRTIFNLLGPMTNPANVRHHLIGVYRYGWAKPMVETLKTLGSRSAWVTHGQDGLDEITVSGETLVTELKTGEISERTIKPQDIGLAVSPLTALKGGDAESNARAILDLLHGKKSAYRDITLMNAGAAIYIAGKTNSYASAINLAAQAIDSGAAREKLAQLIRITNEGL